MSNSVELLYFVQQRCPLYMQSLEEELDVTGELCAGPCHAALLSFAAGTAGPRPQPLLHAAEFQRGVLPVRVCDGKLGD